MIVSSALCGTLGGVVFAGSQGRAAARRRSPRGHRGTHRQRTVRSIFAGLQYRWSGGLSSGQRDDWDAYAADLGEMTGGCDPRPRTGRDFFVGWNLEQLNADARGLFSLGGRDDGPSALGRPPAPTAFDFFFFLTPDDISAQVGGSGPNPVDGVVLLYVARSRDLSFRRNPWHLANTAEILAGPAGLEWSIDVTAADEWAADWVPRPDESVWMKVRFAFVDGRYSTAIRPLQLVGSV